MYVESIIFKRTKESDWEKGYYIGSTENSEHSIILDKNYVPLKKNEKGFSCWDCKTNIHDWIQFRCKDAYPIDEKE